MAGLRFRLSGFDKTAGVQDVLVEKAEVVAEAAQAAAKEAGALLKKDARAAIARGGFSKKWQNALRVIVYPKKGASIDAALYMKHSISYASVFEEGATIRGKPFLWVPTRNSPARIGRSKVTPKKFNSQIAKLRSIDKERVGARFPMLVANYRRGRGRPKKGAPDPIVFVGIPSVTVPKKFDLVGAVKRAVKRLPGLYFKHFKDD